MHHFLHLPHMAYCAGVASRRGVAALAWQPPFFISLSLDKKVGLANLKARQAEVFSPKKRRLEHRGYITAYFQHFTYTQGTFLCIHVQEVAFCVIL